MQVHLSAEMARFAEQMVRSGHYASVDEVVVKALELMEEQEAARAAGLADFQRHVDEALAQSKAGELVDGETYAQALIDELDSRMPGKE